MYNTISSYNNNRKFGENLVVEANENASLCITNPYCSPTFMERSTIHKTRQCLFAPVDTTVQKDVWGQGTCCLRQAMLQEQLDKNWTVFQRRTFAKTPVLWMHEVIRRDTDSEE